MGSAWFLTPKYDVAIKCKCGDVRLDAKLAPDSAPDVLAPITSWSQVLVCLHEERVEGSYLGVC